MEKVIQVGQKSIKFRATGATLRTYRQLFQGDLFKDMNSLQSVTEMSGDALQKFEAVAYTMAYQANKDIEPFEEWLDGFEFLDLYQAMPEIVSLWGLNAKTLSESKKKALTQTGL